MTCALLLNKPNPPFPLFYVITLKQLERARGLGREEEEQEQSLGFGLLGTSRIISNIQGKGFDFPMLIVRV